MDEVSRTRRDYEGDAPAYVEKYLDESVAARYGDAFRDALGGDAVLDVGCGPGPDLETFAGSDYDVTGLDVTRPFLRAASDHVPDASLAQGDMRRLPFRPESFDGVWSSASFLHVPRSDAAATLREFHRVLRDDGVVFLSVKRGEPADREPDDRHFEYYRADELRTLIRESPLEASVVRTEANWVSSVASVQ